MQDFSVESSNETWFDDSEKYFRQRNNTYGFVQYTLSQLNIFAVTKLPSKTLLEVTFILTNVQSEKFFLVERPIVIFIPVFRR